MSPPDPAVFNVTARRPQELQQHRTWQVTAGKERVVRNSLNQVAKEMRTRLAKEAVSIQQVVSSLLTRVQPVASPELKAMALRFAVADSLAIHHQDRKVFHRRVLLLLVSVTIVSAVVARADKPYASYALFTAIVLSLFTVLFQRKKYKKHLHRSLHYRTLAEVLRIHIHQCLNRTGFNTWQRYAHHHSRPVPWLDCAVYDWTRSAQPFDVSQNLALKEAREWIASQFNYFKSKLPEKLDARLSTKWSKLSIACFFFSAVFSLPLLAGAAHGMEWTWLSTPIESFPLLSDLPSATSALTKDLRQNILYPLAAILVPLTAMLGAHFHFLAAEQVIDSQNYWVAFRNFSDPEAPSQPKYAEQLTLPGTPDEARHAIAALGEKAIEENAAWLRLRREFYPDPGR